MSRSVPDRARTLAAELALRFAQDAQLATRLNAARRRLQHPNERLWSGLHRDGSPPSTTSIPPPSTSRQRKTAPTLSAHQTRCRPFSGSTGRSTERTATMRPTQSIGESSPHSSASSRSEFIATLVAAGWSEHDVRGANVDKLANTMTGERNEETPV